ncbi:Alpha/Beta hydrolase protein [Rhodotorula diobovata]|uniref:Alpha/Beta hydrolase protein n=1 Tax=Rhodotorula diobovata TaxID=5288 RepID=A0A5C5FLW7_9BASI|nr:Alpha/Beta hydrolase protein [Rhodotorula diobovata]
MAVKDKVQLSLKRAAPDQRLSLGLFLRWLVFLWLEAFFVLPTRLFFEFVVFRWFSPIVQHVGRPLVAHFFIKLVHFNVTRSVPAQIRILVNSTRSYALAHATPTFLKAGKGWARKVEVNGTKGWWIGDSKNDKSKDDVVVYFIHGGAFLFDSGANSHEFFLSVIKEIKDKHGLNASVFALDYRLPPEYSYPSQLIEALAGYHYLVNDVGVSESKIVVTGDSAGGNLAEALLLHLARPADEVTVPGELGATPKQPGGACFISPFHNLYSASHSLKTNGTFDLLDSTLAARTVFSYIGAGDELPASYQFQPSLNPLRLVFSPQRDLPHSAERLPDVFGFSDIKGIELLRSPYVNPAVCQDKDWWKEAMPGGGRTMVTWGGIEVLADDCEALYDQLEEAGVEPAKLYKELGIHDWVLHDWFLPFSWRTKAKGPEGTFTYGRDHVVDLLNLVASSAKAKSSSRVKELESAHVPSKAKKSARVDEDEPSPGPPREEEEPSPRKEEPSSAQEEPSPEEKKEPSRDKAPSRDKKEPAPAKDESTHDQDKPPVQRAAPAHATAPPGNDSYAHIAADDSHIAASAPVVAEGEQAKIVPVEVQKERAQREKEAHDQAPTTHGPTFARVAADSEHVDPDAPVVAEGEGATIDRSKVTHHDEGSAPAHHHEVQAAQNDSEPPPVSADTPASAPAAEPTAAPAAPPPAPVQEKKDEVTSDLPTKSGTSKNKKKKKKSKAAAAAGASSAAPASGSGQNGRGGSYAAIAAHDDNVAADAPVVAEGEGDVIHRA